MNSGKKIKILFVCTMNYQRSKTAEAMYKSDERFEVKSAGTDKHAINRINEESLNWADFIIIMEKFHRNKIRKEFPEIYENKRIICLYIADEFEFMEAALVNLLSSKFEFIFTREIS